MQKKIIGGLLVSMALPLPAFALSLGEIEVLSSLNEPLNAQIEIKSATARDVNKLIVQLASEKKFIESGINRPFWLTSLKFNPVTKASGKSYIQVTSNSVIREPFLNFLVDAEWPNGRLVREYTLLVDPPAFVNTAPVVTQTQAPKQIDTEIQQGLTEIQNVESELSEPVSVEPLPVTEATSVETFPIEETSVLNDDLPSIDLSMEDGQIEPEEVVVLKPEMVEQPESLVFSEPVEFDDVVIVGDSEDLGENIPALGSGYTVQKGDTMSSIARQYSGDGISLNQVMVAILKANPKAFIKGNVNLVKRGARLNIPSGSEILALSKSKASNIVKQQNALWREYRNTSVTAAPVSPQTQEQNTGEAPVDQNTFVDEQDTVDNNNEQNSQLAIVAPKTPESAKDNADLSSESNSDSAEEITRQLLLARERVAATSLREEELQSRIAELEGIATQSKAVLALKNQKLARMQANAEGTQPSDDVANSDLDHVFKLPEDSSGETDVEVTPPVQDDQPEEQTVATENTVADVQTPAVVQPEVDVNRPDGFLGTVYDLIPSSVRDMISPLLGTSTALAALVILGALILLPLLLLVTRLRKKKAAEGLESTNTLDVKDMSSDESALGVDVTESSVDDFDPEAFAASGVPDTMSQNDIPELAGLSDDEPTVSSDELEISDSESTGVNIEESDPDVVDDTTSEADMYVVYGLHEQAEELLRKAIRENPKKSIYYSKLMEVYKEQDKQVEFLEVAEDFKAMLNGEPSTSWDHAVTLGQEYTPEAAVFAGAAAVAATVESPVTTEETPTDEINTGLDVDGVDDLLVSSEENILSESDSLMNADEMLADVGIGEELDDSFEEMSDQDIADISMGLMEDGSIVDDSTELDADVDVSLLEGSDLIDDVLSDESDVKSALDDVPEVTGAIGSDDLDATIDPSMFDEINANSASLNDAEDSLSNALDDIEGLDLSDLGALDDDALSTKSLDAEDDVDDEMTQLIDDDSLETMIDEIGSDVASFPMGDAEDGFDEIGTKLDLAKAYIDMGDHEGAKESLQEVIDGGNADQKAEAEKLLSEI